MHEKKVQLIIVSVALVCALVGMIVATALIGKKKDAEWEYISSDEKINYDNSSDYSEFQHAENFRHSVEKYFTSLFQGFIANYTDVDSSVENLMQTFADKLVAAMSEARISSAKLNKISQAIENNSVEAIFAKIKTELSKLKSMEELESKLAEKVKDMTFIGWMGGIVSGFMNETALTEDEIANIFYYYLKQNRDEKYRAYLDLAGREFFVSLISDTIYTMDRLNDISASEYQLEATTNSVKTILYELGSVYTKTSMLSGGGETMEKILGWTWEYGDKFENADELNEYATSCKGKIGDLFGVIGCVMKEFSSEDIGAMLEYVSSSDEKEKSDKKIITAAKLAKCFERAYSSVEKVCSTEFGSVEGIAKTYSDVSKSLGELAFAIFEPFQQKAEVEDATPEDFSERFDNFIEGYNYMLEYNGTLDGLKSMSADSQEYINIKDKADKLFEIEQGIISVFSNIVSVKIANLAYDFVGEATK